MIKYLNNSELVNKTAILRVDFNVPIKQGKILDDSKIKQCLPSINYLLAQHNKIILISHLGRPKSIDKSLSLHPVYKLLTKYLVDVKIGFTDNIDDIGNKLFKHSVVLVENIRFYKQEESLDLDFAQKIASNADFYVNDAFAVSHRKCSTITLLPTLLPSYAGLLMKKEIENLSKVLINPKQPVVSILGGAKIKSKLHLIEKLIKLSDYVLIGGGIGNTFLNATKQNIGSSLAEQDEGSHCLKLLKIAMENKTKILLPVDFVVANNEDSTRTTLVLDGDFNSKTESIFDIGSQTQAIWGNIIIKAKTIIWNGPVGLIENPAFQRGTDFIYYSISQNTNATSIIGGGETLLALKHKEYLENITHISTGGGAMLEFLEKGTLVGIDALK